MRVRTCPGCKRQYSKLEYMKTFINTIWTNVECKRCNQKMTIDLSRRIVVALAFGFWMIILNTFTSSLEMNALMWIIAIAVFLLGSLYIFTFDNFKKIE